MRISLKILLLCNLCLVFVSSGNVYSHPLAPSLLEVREQQDQTLTIQWRTPVFAQEILTPQLPPNCRSDTPVILAPDTSQSTNYRGWQLNANCGEKGLLGLTFGVGGLSSASNAVLLRLHHRNNVVQNVVLTAEESTFTVNAEYTTLTTLSKYFYLGFEHLMSGIDHLLFILGLLLLAKGWLLVGTITAFTVGHSLSMALAVLGYVRLPQQWLEFFIAVSIVVLALEVARNRQGHSTFFSRHPSSFAFGFGLFHGLSFATVISALTITQPDVLPWLLLSFNLGIEAGQLLIVAIFFILMLVATTLLAGSNTVKLNRLGYLGFLYAIGGGGMYWTLERLLNIVVLM